MMCVSFRLSFAMNGVCAFIMLSTVTHAFVGLDEMPMSCDVPCMIDAQAERRRLPAIAAARVQRPKGTTTL